MTLFANTTAITGGAGGTNTVDPSQPTLALNWLICAEGIFPYNQANPLQATQDDPYLGEIRCLAFNQTPSGWLPCDGRVLTIQYNQALFSLLGTQYGGDGFRTFALPDLRNRVVVGMDNGSYRLGTSGGGYAVPLGIPNLPSHVHTMGAESTSATGSGTGFDTRQPFLALNVCMESSGDYFSMGWIRVFGFNFTPPGFYPCIGGNGSVSVSAALFSRIGTAFGGDGSTTFGIPDLRGRSLLGAGSGAGLTMRNVGDAPGNATHSVSVAELPGHVHPLPAGATGSTGDGAAFDNMKPAVTFNAGIAEYGLYLTTGSDPMVGEVRFFANPLPPLFVAADGSSVPVTGNAALSSILGTVFGGDGVVALNLPDLRGRFAAGASSFPLGTAWGAETLALNATQIPWHTHDYGPASDGGADFAISLPEGTSNVLSFYATTADSLPQPLTFALAGGADAAAFAVDPATGLLTFTPPPNFELPTDANHDNVYEVEVSVTEAGVPGATATLSLSVSITNVFEMPIPGPSFSTNALLGVPLTIRIIGGPYSPVSGDGDPLWLSAVICDYGASVSTDGTNVTYLPLAGDSGFFVYTVSNGDGGTAQQTVQVGKSPNPGQTLLSIVNAPEGAVVVQGLGVSGLSYALDFTPALGTPAWTPLTTNLAAPDGSLWFKIDASSPQGFFRTRYVP